MTDSEKISMLEKQVADLTREVNRLQNLYESKRYDQDDEDWDDDDYDYDEDDWREEQEERRLEELAERAATCKCGAWQFAKNGDVVHVADCCCGAE